MQRRRCQQVNVFKLLFQISDNLFDRPRPDNTFYYFNRMCSPVLAYQIAYPGMLRVWIAWNSQHLSWLVRLDLSIERLFDRGNWSENSSSEDMLTYYLGKYSTLSVHLISIYGTSNWCLSLNSCNIMHSCFENAPVRPYYIWIASISTHIRYHAIFNAGFPLVCNIKLFVSVADASVNPSYNCLGQHSYSILCGHNIVKLPCWGSNLLNQELSLTHLPHTQCIYGWTLGLCLYVWGG